MLHVLENIYIDLNDPKCFQKRDNVEKHVSTFKYAQIFHTWSTWDIAQGCSACVMHTYINIYIRIYEMTSFSVLVNTCFSPVMFLNKSWNIYLMLWSSLCRLQYPLTKLALQIAHDSVNIHQNFKTGCAAWKITQITTQGLNDTSIQTCTFRQEGECHECLGYLACLLPSTVKLKDPGI